jgi:hypothetical protein
MSNHFLSFQSKSCEVIALVFIYNKSFSKISIEIS